MCKYCKEDIPIFDKDIISEFAWGWGNDDFKINLKQAKESEMKWGLFIDKRDTCSYLRFADLMDCDCMDSGLKIDIKYCPCCGDKL